MRIEQVVVNLLTNALRYGNASQIELKLFKNPHSVTLSVHDQGSGIAKEKLEKILKKIVLEEAEYIKAVIQAGCRIISLAEPTA